MRDFRTCSTGIAALAAACALIAMPAFAGQTTGTIDVELNVTNACVVNGATAVSTAFGSAGRILFTDQPGLFGNTDAQLVSAANSAISVLCSPGAAPSLTIGAGANDDAGQRRLASGANRVAYRLFSDSGRTDEIIVGRQLSLGTATSAAMSVPIYARVNSNGEVLAAGKYTDTVQVELSW